MHLSGASPHFSAVFIDDFGQVYFFFLSAIIFIIFWDSLMFHQIFLSPQVKRCAIITYKRGIYELRHELLNDLRLRILGN